MINRLTPDEMLMVNGHLVTGRDLAEARQELAHKGAHLDRWDELPAQDQEDAAVIAAAYLRSLGTIASDRWYAGELPTFEEIRARAYGETGDVLDTLRSDWLDDHGPNDEQAEHLAAESEARAARAQDEDDDE